MFYEAAGNRHGLAHDPFKAIVSPRPIGWISTRSKAGAVNLAPYSFFNAISTEPMLVMFSSSSMKDSAAFAIESGEFVANFVSRDLGAAMNRSSADAPRGVSEFAFSGVDEAASVLVSAPRVRQAPAALECRVTQWFHPSGLDGRASPSVMVIGEVVGVHIADAFVRDGRFDMAAAPPLSRLGYLDYGASTDLFEMRRPRRPDASDV
jgi:flavin reductase (DIM6/NTAB) family NADH-FMN oxidoreductase RutF